MDNKLTFEACEKGDLVAAINQLRQTDLSFEDIQHLRNSGFINKIKNTDEKGETGLHLAVREDCQKLVKNLVNLDDSLCSIANNEGETPLKLAVSLSLREAVEILVTQTPNALHCIAELNQVELVEYLLREKGKVDLSQLINEPYKLPTNSTHNEGNRATDPQHIQPIDGGEQHPEQKSPQIQNTSGDGGGKPSQSAARNKRTEEKNSYETDSQDDQPIVRLGDTPLHIAARNKFEHMVNLLLKVRKVNKLARNSEGKTPVEIAKEVTEYHESFRTIRRLGDFKRQPRPFMYCAPQVSHKKYMKARLMVNKAYEDRRNAELVVAALLAAMTCAAAFTVPGGFNSDSPVKENGGSPAPNPSHLQDDQGTPLLVSLVSFKLFLVFDCVAFFLSLFVCIMWEMSCELTTGDKMLFMTVNSLVVCCSFGFTSYGFMAAVYSMLARKVETFSWVVLGSLIAITSCGVLAFIRQSLHFAVTRARFHRLCGVSCFVDDIVEKVWCGAEYCGLLNLVRSGDDVSHDLISGIAPCCSCNNV